MSKKRRNSTYFRSRRLESLEPRELLAGHGFAAAFSHGFYAGAAPAQQVASFHAGSAITQAATHASSTAAGQTVLTANLTDATTGAAGTVTYKTYTSQGVVETELKVSVTGAAASSTLDVTLGDAVIGQITTDVNGAGSLVLSNNPTGDEVALPENFPTGVAAGLAVSVGTLTGTLAAGSTTTHSGGCHQESQTNLSASLTDGAASATVTLKSSTTKGVAATQLTVTVSGAAASSSLDVSIGGVVVGQVATDEAGAGSLTLATSPTTGQQQLPRNFPTGVTAGTTVQVGTLSGTFAATSHTSTSSLRSFRHR